LHVRPPRPLCWLVATVFMVGALTPASASPGPNLTPTPDIPDVFLFEGSLGPTATRVQKGILWCYYWEEGDTSELHCPPAFKARYRVPWPKAAAVGSSAILRLRFMRSLPPLEGWQFGAWRRVRKSDGHPLRRHKVQFDCMPYRPGSQCRFEPTVYDGGLVWDVVFAAPEAPGHYYVTVVTSWHNLEDAEPLSVQEARWQFHFRLR